MRVLCINDRPGFPSEMHRVLRPDGVLVISTHHPAADWHRLGGSYFAFEAVTEKWSKGWQITAWRIPLTQLAAEFADAGFLIERLVEPAPDPQMAASHPESFQKLSTEPAFIFFRLVKMRKWRHVSAVLISWTAAPATSAPVRQLLVVSPHPFGPPYGDHGGQQ